MTPTCGIAGERGIIGLFDDPASFYGPERVNAQLIWFRHGSVENRFPNRLPPKVTVDRLLDQRSSIAVRIGVEADATHVGGLKLFGRKFGNYAQDIRLRLRYH